MLVQHRILVIIRKIYNQEHSFCVCVLLNCKQIKSEKRLIIFFSGVPCELYIFYTMINYCSLIFSGHLEMRLDPIRMLAVKEHMKGNLNETYFLLYIYYFIYLVLLHI